MECAPTSEENQFALIEGIVQRMQTETKCERADQIRDAVKAHLKTWLDEVEKLNPLFKVLELIQVGSYAEGTKIVQPDEFDFLAVVGDLSQPGSVIIDESASDLEQGLVRVTVADKLKSRWSMLCKDGHLQCFQRINFPDEDGERFGHLFISVLKKKVKEFNRTIHLAGKLSFGLPFDLMCEIPLHAENNISLLLKGAEYRTPNVLLNFELENREIIVDLSPAIRNHKIADCFEVEDCAGPAFADLVLRRKSLLLVATKSESDLKVTVTEAEVQYMKSVIKHVHKRIYIFLKYLKKLYADECMAVPSFTSYMLKTVCIRHDIKCMSEGRTITTCLKAVIVELEECTRHNDVRSIVNRHLRLYFAEYVYGPYEWVEQNRKCVIGGLGEICQLPQEITTVEDFDAFINGLLLHERHRRIQERLREEAKQLNSGLNDPTKAVEHLLNGTLGVVDEEPTLEESHTKDNRVAENKVLSSSGRESSQTSSESLSGGQNTAACELIYIPKPNEESQQSSTNAQCKTTCEILYQRKHNYK